MDERNHSREERAELSNSVQPETSCCGPQGCCDEIDRRGFVKAVGAGTAIAAGITSRSVDASDTQQTSSQERQHLTACGDDSWPILKSYDSEHLSRIALPLGGIGTGTVSLGGRGDLRDWEIMNRPAKGFVPLHSEAGPFFALYAKAEGEEAVTRVLEGPVELSACPLGHSAAIMKRWWGKDGEG